MSEKNSAYARQLKLIELLEHYDLSKGTSIADKYIGALRTLVDHENTDRFSQAANSIRTLLVDFAGGDKRLDSHSMLKTIMESPDPLEAISKMKQTWDGRWDFKIGIRDALANIDPFFSDVSEEDHSELVNNLNKIKSYFSKLLHKSYCKEGTFNSDDFFRMFRQLEEYLLSKMKLIILSDVYRTDDAIIAFERHDNIESFLGLAGIIKGSRIIKSYLFNTITHPKWIPHLIDQGFFQDVVEKQTHEDGSISYPRCPESRYLVNVASTDPKAVMASVTVIPKTDNINVLTDLVDIALKVPVELAKDIAQRAVDEKWVLHPHGFIVRSKLHELTKKLIAEGNLKNGYKLTREIIFCLPGYGDLREEIEVDKANYSFDHSGDPDQYIYSKFVKEVCPDIIREVGLEGFKDLCQALNKVVTISESGKRGTPYDYSYIERPAIEDHKANFREGIFNSLVEGIRNAGLKMLKKEPRQISEMIRVLHAQDWGIFARLGMHFLLHTQEPPKEILEDYFSKRDYYEDSNTRREFIFMAKKWIPLVSKETRDQVLAFARTVDSEEEFREWHLKFFGSEPAAGDYEKYVGQTITSNFEPFLDFLEADDRKLYDSYVAKYGKPKTRDHLQHYVEAGWGGKSAKTADDLLEMPVPELLDFLKDWKSEDERTGPSTLGLSRELKTAIGRKQDNFIPYSKEFEIPDKPWFVRAYFEGMRDAVRAKKPIDWQSVLNLVEWVMKQGMEITTSEFEPADNMEKDWSWCHAAIAELLKEGMNEATSTGYDFRYRNQTWGIIRPIATTPDPDREARITTDSDYDPYMSAINSVRGKGFEAMVEYGLWYSREYKKEYGKEPGQAEGLTFSFKMIPGFEKAIDFHLKEEKEPSVAIRSLYGRWFPWFVTLDVEWARANVKFIFPKGEENHELYSVAWETYVIYNQPWTGVFPLLEAEYRNAIMDIKHRKLKKRFGGEDPNKRLADHLITMYWWGYLDFDSDDGLLKLFYDNATTEVRAHIIWFVGNSLSKAPKPVNEDVMRRMKSLWAYHLDTLGDLEQHREELSKFTWWFNSGAFDDDPEWAFEQQKKALEHGITPDFIPEVVAKLIDLAEDHTIQCLETLEGLLVVGADTVANYFWEGRAKDVLGIAMKDKSAEVQDKVRSLVNEFMKLGFFDFKDILNKEQEE